MREKIGLPGLIRILEYGGLGLLLLTVLLLPITSLPLLSSRMGGTLVSPPAIITVMLAAPIWLLLLILRRLSLPREALPWLAFCGAVVLSSALAFFLPLPPYRSFTPLEAETSAVITFVISAVFYLLFASWLREPRDFAWILRAVNLGGMLILAWSLAQLYVVLVQDGNYPGLMVRMHSWISIRSLGDRIFTLRLTGLAFEPSWLAHQLNLVYLPLWLGATISGYSSFRKVLRLSLENVLLILGLIVLVFTYSRIGLLAILLALAYGIFQASRSAVRWLRAWLIRHNWPASPWLGPLLGLGLALIYVLAVLALLSILSRSDPRIARLLSMDGLPANLLDFAAQVDFAERVLYWMNGWQVFARYPFLGVGLGNAGFFFREHLPAVGLRFPEISQILNQALFLPNIKSFWVRLLAETGLLGTSLFLSWYLLLWTSSRNLAAQPSALMRALGWMGSLSLITFLAEGFSVDSFALPYLWVSLGLLTAASALARKGKAGS